MKICYKSIPEQKPLLSKKVFELKIFVLHNCKETMYAHYFSCDKKLYEIPAYKIILPDQR